MPVYHIVLFKLKPSASSTAVEEFASEAEKMVGQIPGLRKMSVGPPLAITAHRAQGYDMGLVALLETKEDVPKYGVHPAHLKVHQMREELCDGTLAFDLEFD